MPKCRAQNTVTFCRPGARREMMTRIFSRGTTVSMLVERVDAKKLVIMSPCQYDSDGRQHTRAGANGIKISL